jgi:hypothetical protein
MTISCGDFAVSGASVTNGVCRFFSFDPIDYFAAIDEAPKAGSCDLNGAE